ncbi:MAG TPA: PLP-dependent aminotransferase family protein [Acidobacteriaceae bacterium]|nr:PLP-dependent aminotransferase family protein [Acidobacteriaceae bacterium]
MHSHYDPCMLDVSAGIVPVIPIDREADAPLHRQVYAGFRDAILRGDLAAGQQVPSSRSLAAELEISRFPVLDAYAQLLAEGYFESRVGAGTFVASSLPYRASNPKRPAEEAPSSRRTSRRSALFPAYDPPAWRSGWGSFAVHQPALDHFPFELWSKLVARHSRTLRIHAPGNIHPLGLQPFREAICSYLRTARAVRCEPGQIMVVSGSQQALDIVTRVLLDPGDAAWMEEPCYPLMRSLLTGSGCRAIPVPVDEDGLDVTAGMRLAPDARVAFVTPSHHYALGVTMSASRRFQLLEWSRQASSWIVEDDYDSEYRFDTMPIPSLQGLDPCDRVIYIGTFSKVLRPSLRLGYIVIPADLVDRFAAVRFSMDIFPSYLFQEALTDFMQDGHFARHIRRMRALYKGRRAALVECLRAEFGDFLKIHGSEAGMHLTVTFPQAFRAGAVSDVDIATRAAKDKLWLWPLSPCYTNGRARQGFILGFGNTPEEQMPGAVRKLRQLLSA